MFQQLVVLTVCSASMILSSVTQATVTITQTERGSDGHLRILFTDSSPPGPYRIEGSGSLETGAEWSLFDALTVTLAQPPVYQIDVPPSAAQMQFYRIAAMPDDDPLLPSVIATEPADESVNVPTSLSSVRITFDRPMSGAVSLAADDDWGASYAIWSADRRTVEIRRLSAPRQLPALATLRFRLNPGGKGFADDEGRLIVPASFSFTTGLGEVSGPQVMSSYPAGNALDVDPWLDAVELHFTEPMMATGGFVSSGWWPWTLEWSGDGRTAFVRRGTAGTPLYGQNVFLQTMSFRTLSGVPLAQDFVLRFRTANPPMIRIDADPTRGFHWPYLMMIPPEIHAPGTLLVEPNNTGTWGDDPWLHEESARDLLRRHSSFAVELGCPLMIPMVTRPRRPEAPEPGGIYTHALDRYSLFDNWDGLRRIDLQMVAMIEDAIGRLRAMGHAIDSRVFMMGFSASGAFTSRFTLLHPDRIKAASAGSPGGWPLAPVASWNGVTLKYPIGVADVETLIGRPFDLDAFRQVPLHLYMGDRDTNDALDVRGMTPDERSGIHEMLNYPADLILANRWPLAQAIYDSVQANARFVVYPGVGHSISPQMWDDIRLFFREHR